MSYPPAPPGPPGGHDATQAFPAGGAPPPPPTEPPPAEPAPAAPRPVDPGAPPAQDATGQLPHPGYGGPAGYGSYGGYATPPGAGYGSPAYAAPAAPPAPGGRGKGRVLGRALLVLVVVGALAGTTAWGFVNRSSAERWRDRSEAADADLRDGLDRVEATTDDLEAAEARLRDLASENAGETDRNRILSEIVAQAPEVTAALADCQQETTDLANDIIAAVGDPAADVTGLEARTDDVNAVCAAALDQAEQLEAAIEGLGT